MADDFSIQQIRSLMGPSPLEPLGEIQPAGSGPAGKPQKPGEPSFTEMLKESIEEVNSLKIEADQAIENLAMGKSADLQGTILAVEKADISFKLMMEVRNKILSAYQEVMRTQI